VALLAPTMQGMPSSLATMAAWQVMPPSSVMIAPALVIMGTMSGVVIWVTKISPSLIRSRLVPSLNNLTLPLAIPGLAPSPFTRMLPEDPRPISFDPPPTSYLPEEGLDGTMVVIGLA